MADLTNIINTLIEGDKEKLGELVQSALAEDVSAKDILDDGLVKGMEIVGAKMESCDMYIPEVLRSAGAMSGAVEILKPLLTAEELSASGTVVIGTVKGDLHDMGKNLVKLMLESAGFEVVDLGVDVDVEAFIDAVKESGANILALSALLTTTMPVMKRTVEAAVEEGLRDGLKIVVGGAPVTQKFADDIGADGYAADAGAAGKLLKSMMG